MRGNDLDGSDWVASGFATIAIFISLLALYLSKKANDNSSVQTGVAVRTEERDLNADRIAKTAFLIASHSVTTSQRNSLTIQTKMWVTNTGAHRALRVHIVLLSPDGSEIRTLSERAEIDPGGRNEFGFEIVRSSLSESRETQYVLDYAFDDGNGSHHCTQNISAMVTIDDVVHTKTKWEYEDPICD